MKSNTFYFSAAPYLMVVTLRPAASIDAVRAVSKIPSTIRTIYPGYFITADAKFPPHGTAISLDQDYDNL